MTVLVPKDAWSSGIDLDRTARPKPGVELRVIRRISASHVKSVAFSPTGKVLAVLTETGEVRIWRVGESRVIAELRLPEKTSVTLIKQPLAFSPDGKMLAACFDPLVSRQVLRIWETDGWKILNTVDDSRRGPGCRGIAFSSDNQRLLRITPQNIQEPSVFAYDTQSWRQEFSVSTGPFYPKHIAVGPQSNVVAIAGAVRNPVLWNLPGKAPTFGDPPLADTRAVLLLDVNSGELRRTVTSVESVSTWGAVAWRPTTSQLAISGAGGFSFIESSTGASTVVHPATGLEANNSLVYSTSGEILAEGSFGKTQNWLRIWTGDHLKLLSEQRREVRALSFSNDGTMLAVASEDEVEVYSIKMAGFIDGHRP